MDHERFEQLIGKRHTLAVLELLHRDGPLNYTEVETRIDSSSDVVTNRLTTLVNYDLVERDEQTPRDVRYDTTERGSKFFDQIQAAEMLLES